MNKKIIVLSVIGVLVLIGVFSGGMLLGKNKSSSFNNNGFGMQNRDSEFNGMVRGKNQMGNGGLMGGEIISKDDKSITIKSIGGASRIIFFDSNTTVSKMTTGTITDLVTGSQISITGTTNSDGSITAKTIQIRPEIEQKTQPQQ